MTVTASTLWQPHPGPQTGFLRSPVFEALYGGAAGGGKTDSLIWDQAGESEHPAFKGLFLRRSFPELREVMDRMHAWFPKLGAGWNATDKRWEFPSGAHITVGYGETFAEMQQYGGFEFTCVSYDEAGHLVEERAWTFLQTRIRSTYDGPLPLLLRQRGSANPGGAGHAWMKKRFVDACPSDGTPVFFKDAETGELLTRAFFAARIEDNPTLLRNKRYIAQLNSQGELIRRQLREGDWNAGAGLALDQLLRQKHLVAPFRVPGHWRRFGAFDWGFNHPFAFGHFAADDDGNVVLVNSVHGRRRQPDDIALRITEGLRADPVNAVDPGQLDYIAAGHDCWADHKARGENAPTIAEALAQYGLHLTPANISRVAGLNNFRRYVQWKVPLPDDPDRWAEGTPRFTLMDTPGNRHAYGVLESIPTDPHDPEDARKMDADDEGRGGDDPYDMCRYGLASRPVRAVVPPKPVLGAWDPRALAEEAAVKRTVRALPMPTAHAAELEAGAGW